MKNRVYIKDIGNKKGEEVTIFGFAQTLRIQSKIIFMVVRDITGTTQAIIEIDNEQAFSIAKGLSHESVVKVTGIVKDGPKDTFEIGVQNIEVLSYATPELPIPVVNKGSEAGEEARLQYRYLDLRKPNMADNLKMRHKVIKFVRDYLDKESFIEIETPILTKSTPEGARDYVVPSRLYPGKFYALPQSPQQYKQLLMAGGLERYFQVARCFRDEDTRADRQPEFTQMDLEMSYVTQEDIMSLNEKLIIELVQTLYPHKKIQQIPFPRITYADAMEQYGIDRPDIRTDKNDPDLLAFCWVIDFPFFEKNDEGGWTFTHNPFSAPQPEYMTDLMEGKNIESILAAQYDIVLNGFEIGGGSIRNHNPEALKKVLGIMGYGDDQIEANFGHMLKAFSCGTPPHGGIAWGLDRFVTLLQNESSIREVIAFPKTGEGKDLMMESPSEISQKQKKELGL